MKSGSVSLLGTHHHKETPLQRVSVIVLNWNGLKWLQPCFDSVLAQSQPAHELILADNHSTDDSLPFTAQRYPAVKVITLPENQGYAGANNQAAKSATGEWLMFLNNDAKLEPRCLERAMAYAAVHPEAGLLTPVIWTYAGETLINQGLGCDILGFPLQSGKVFYADGCSVLIRRELFEHLGGFDPTYFIFFEESDLAWRARLLGADVQCVPDAVVYHHMGGSVTSQYGESTYTTTYFRRKQGERNNFRNLLKNYSGLTLCWVLPLAMAVSWGEVLVFLFTGRWGVVRHVYLQAWWENLKVLPQLLAARWHVQRSRRVSDAAIFRHLTWTIAKLRHVKRYGLPKFSDK